MKQDATLRFWSKVDIQGPDECWLWLASTRGTGQYGQFWYEDSMVMAHRFSYFLTYGKWPFFTIDHICREHLCVNPKHLEDVTIKENVGRSPRALKQLCPKGHLLDGLRRETNNSHKQRYCRECGRKASLAWYHKTKVRRVIGGSRKEGSQAGA